MRLKLNLSFALEPLVGNLPQTLDPRIYCIQGPSLSRIFPLWRTLLLDWSFVCNSTSWVFCLQFYQLGSLFFILGFYSWFGDLFDGNSTARSLPSNSIELVFLANEDNRNCVCVCLYLWFPPRVHPPPPRIPPNSVKIGPPLGLSPHHMVLAAFGFHGFHPQKNSWENF